MHMGQRDGGREAVGAGARGDVGAQTEGDGYVGGQFVVGVCLFPQRDDGGVELVGIHVHAGCGVEGGEFHVVGLSLVGGFGESLVEGDLHGIVGGSREAVGRLGAGEFYALGVFQVVDVVGSEGGHVQHERGGMLQHGIAVCVVLAASQERQGEGQKQKAGYLFHDNAVSLRISGWGYSFIYKACAAWWPARPLYIIRSGEGCRRTAAWRCGGGADAD